MTNYDQIFQGIHLSLRHFVTGCTTGYTAFMKKWAWHNFHRWLYLMGAKLNIYLKKKTDKITFRVSTIKSLYVVHHFKKYHILGHLFTQETSFSEFLKTTQIFCYKFFPERYSIFQFFILFFFYKNEILFQKKENVVSQI